jgi:hypothetical protein
MGSSTKLLYLPKVPLTSQPAQSQCLPPNEVFMALSLSYTPARFLRTPKLQFTTSVFTRSPHQYLSAEQDSLSQDGALPQLSDVWEMKDCLADAGLS